MDAKIKKTKKAIDKDMNALLIADKKNDKKHDTMMEKCQSKKMPKKK